MVGAKWGLPLAAGLVAVGLAGILSLGQLLYTVDKGTISDRFGDEVLVQLIPPTEVISTGEDGR